MQKQMTVIMQECRIPPVAGTSGDPSLIPGSRVSPGGGNGNPLQYSCLENPMDRGAGGQWSIRSQRVGHD